MSSKIKKNVINFYEYLVSTGALSSIESLVITACIYIYIYNYIVYLNKELL